MVTACAPNGHHRSRSVRTVLTSREDRPRQHPATATSLSNLAGLLQDQGDLVGARPLLERALSIHEEVVGPQHPNTVTVRRNLAVLLGELGESTDQP
jgi:hypothetical protein